MSIEIIVSIIGLFITILINICVIAYFAGTLKANQDYHEKVIADLKEEVNKNFERIERKQDKHNSVIERQFIAEGKINVLEEKVEVANHRIADLEEVR